MTRTYVFDARTASDHFPGIGRYVSSLAAAMESLITPEEALVILSSPDQKPGSGQTLPAHWQLPGAWIRTREEIRPGKINLVEAPVSPFSLAQQWQIPRQVKLLGADVYHSPYYLMPYRVPVPTVFTLYDLIPQLYPQYVSTRARLLFRLATRLALHAADHVITISEATRRDLLQSYPVQPGRVTAVPLAPDTKFKPQPPDVIKRVRYKYSLPEHYVLYFGINKPHKNLVNLVQAWGEVLERNSHPRLTLVIAGAWDARHPQAKAAAVVSELDHSIHFLGPIPDADLPGLYSGASLFVFPSLYEGFGLPVIEAMACGTAVACSSTSSLPEVGGQAALLFDPNQPDQIAGAISALLQDPEMRRRRSSLGVQQAAEFTWQRCARQTLAIYRELLQAD